MKKNIIAGNWKMNFSVKESEKFLNDLVPKLSGVKCEVVICPPFTSLYVASDILKNSNIKLGAQNIHFEESGAFTGEISASMLKSLNVSYVIIGHSERRTYFNESNEDINKKIFTCLKHELTPIICVGETLSERESGSMRDILKSQINGAFLNISKLDANKIVIAYEPVWAIGTGKTATNQEANDAIGFIRDVIRDIYDNEVAQEIVILYGGSVKPSTIKEQMAMDNIDGALVGGASIVVDDFEAIVKF